MQMHKLFYLILFFVSSAQSNIYCSALFDGQNQITMYSPVDSKKTIAFIRSMREAIGVDADLTADERPLYDDLQKSSSVFEASSGVLLIVKNADGEIVGSGGFTRLNESTCELKKFYLHPSLRGQGFGKKLLEDLMLKAANRGYKKMILQTDKRMVQAISLYKSMGFEPFQTSSNNALYFYRELPRPSF